MRFTAQEEYGLRCMLQFARHSHRGADGAFPPQLPRGGADVGRGSAAAPSLTIGEIADIEGLTPQYAGKLIRILRMGGLLESVRGRHGGYRLAGPVDRISVGEVLAVLGGRVFEPAYCSRYTGDRKLCVHTVDCAIRSLWGALQATMDGILSKIFLRDLMGKEQGVAKWLRSVTEPVPMDFVPVEAVPAVPSTVPSPPGPPRGGVRGTHGSNESE